MIAVSIPTRTVKDRPEMLKTVLQQVTIDRSGSTQPTEMADHFLESAAHKKHENTGLIFLGQKIRGLEVKMTLGTYNYENVYNLDIHLQ